MLLTLIRTLFPKTVDKIASEEADRMCQMMANGGALQCNINDDLVVFGMIRVIPRAELRKDHR